MAEENTVAEEAATEEVATEPTREDELGAIFDKANAEETQEESGPARGPDGKFIAKDAAGEPEEGEAATAEEAESAAVENDADQGAEEEGEAEATQALEPPASWSATAKANWPNLSRELQDEILRREADWQKADGERANQLKGYEPVSAALEPVRQNLQLNGIDEGTYVRQLVAADQFLRQQPEQALQWIAQQYGVDLQQMQQAESDLDPSVAPLVQEINQLKSQLTGFVSQQQQTEAQRVQAEMDAFAKDHPHFEEVRQQMGALIQAGSATDLQTAYDMAVWANPTTRASLQAEQSAEAERKRKEEAEAKRKKAERVADTNLSSKGTAGGQTPPQYKDRDDELGAIFDRVQGAA